MLADIQSLLAAADDADRIERIRQFETLKSAIAAAQLWEASQFDASQRVEQATAGQPPSRQGRGVSSQVALALRQSPWYANRWLGWAKILTRELPVTFDQLRAGATTEARALLIARETVWLSREDRAEVDALLGPELPRLGDARIQAEAKKQAYRLDPAGFVARRRVAARERRVSVRPRPDTMGTLCATTTIERAVAAWATLRRDADTLVGVGENEGRTRDEVMSDLLIERVTGQSRAEGPAVEVELIISADVLLDSDTDTNTELDAEDIDVEPTDIVAAGDVSERCRPRRAGDEPALLSANGLTPTPIPASIARALIAQSSQAWLRRLFTHPGTGELVAMQSQRRQFPEGLRRLIRYRDQYCATPYCGAPIRHTDHATPAEHDGPTNARNGNGKCAACNWAKQAPGWRQSPGRTGVITTPTGHRYHLSPPRPPGAPPSDYSPVVELFWHALDAA